MKLFPPLLLSLSLALSAQDKPNDPFIKSPAAAPQPPDGPTDITMLVETITLPPADYAAWLDEPGGREKLHARAIEAVKSGKAALDGLHFIRAKDGNRIMLESVEDIRSPTEWDAALESGYQHPTAFETYSMGDRIEMEFTMEKNVCNHVHHTIQRQRFAGFRHVKPDSTPPHVVAPDIVRKNTPGSARALSGVPVLLATHALAGSVTLLFGTTRSVILDKKPAAPEKTAANIVLTPRVISLDRQRAWDMLRRHPEDSAACLAELKTMLAAKEAALEHLATLNTLSGQRATHEAGSDFIFGAEFNPPAKDISKPDATDGQAGHSAFTSIRLGYQWEAESIFNDETGCIHTTFDFSRVTHAGDMKDALWSPNYPVLPVFTRQHVTTTITQQPGTTILVSTLNPPGDTGVNDRKDENRVWLLFLETLAP